MGENIKIAVLGGGLWGTVLAQHLIKSRNNPQVWLWEFFPEAAKSLAENRRHPNIPGFRLDEKVTVTADLQSAAESAKIILFVLPSVFVRRTAQSLRKYLGRLRPVIVNASKGLEPKTLLTLSDVIASELPGLPIYALSGPSFAKEVAQGVPTKMVLAGPPGAGARTLSRLLNGRNLRISLSSDRKGVELGGALKNVLAIGCGILDGLNAGANTKAALFVTGMNEMSEIIRKGGGKSETIYGLSGLGDLMATGTSAQSRNRTFGEKLGQGKSAQAARQEINTVVEGIEAAHGACATAKRLRVKAPLLFAIGNVISRGKPAKSVLDALGFGD